MSIPAQGAVGAETMTIDHEFKSHPDVFWPAARGEKTFEYRRDDRGGYEVGQTVRLRCYDPDHGYHGNPPLDRRITNILRGGEFELPMGYCILSLAPLASPRADSDERTAGGWRKVMRDLIAEHDKHACLHEETHRGGAIWTICDHCGRKWADDEGGFQPYEEPAAVTAAWALLKCEDATPAHPAGAVPDSLRALSEAATQGEWYAANGTDIRARGVLGAPLGMTSPAGDGNGLNDRAFVIALANWFRSIASHPAGQSDDGTERCIACAEPLKTGEQVLSDANGGTIHAACCGPERESYTGADGEPLGPNDPIPQGYAYEPEHPAGQSAGSGAETLAATLAEFQRRNGYHKREIEELLTEFGELLLSKVQPAADRTRTGQGEETVTVPASALRWLFGEGPDADGRWFGEWQEGDPDLRGAFWWRSEFRKRIEAAHPAAPEAQGAWLPIETAPREHGRELLGWGRLRGSAPMRAIMTWFDAGGDFNGKSGWWTFASLPFEPIAFQPLPAPPSSGQGGR